jgi:hypothetical protein
MIGCSYSLYGFNTESFYKRMMGNILLTKLNMKIINREIMKATQLHGMIINYGLVCLGYFSKIFQFLLPQQKCR